MRKQILIPSDFSGNAYNAMEYAFNLFKNEECDFYIVHSYYLTGYSKDNLLIPVPSESQLEAVKETSKKNMENLKTKVNSNFSNPKHSLSFMSEFGHLLEVLKNKIKEYNIGLVLMGTRGRTEGSDIAYGRNSVVVMEKIRSCPVMSIPANVTIKEPEKIVFAASYRWEYRPEEMKTLVNMCKQIGASVQVLHVGKEKDLSDQQLENKKKLEEYLAPVEYSFHWIKKVGVKQGLLKFIEEENSDMIVFVNRKHWFFGSVFSNPLVKNLGIHSTVPILALHDA